MLGSPQMGWSSYMGGGGWSMDLRGIFSASGDLLSFSAVMESGHWPSTLEVLKTLQESSLQAVVSVGKGLRIDFLLEGFFLVDFSGSSEGTKPAGRWPKLLCQERLWGDFFLFQTNLFLNWWNGTRWFGSWGIPLEALLFLGYTPRIRKPPAQNHLFGNSCFHFQTFFFCLVGTGTPRFFSGVYFDVPLPDRGRCHCVRWCAECCGESGTRLDHLWKTGRTFCENPTKPPTGHASGIWIQTFWRWSGKDCTVQMQTIELRCIFDPVEVTHQEAFMFSKGNLPIHLRFAMNLPWEGVSIPTKHLGCHAFSMLYQWLDGSHGRKPAAGTAQWFEHLGLGGKKTGGFNWGQLRSGGRTNGRTKAWNVFFFSKHLYIQKKWRKSTWNLAFLSLEVDQGDILHILVDDKSQFHRISLCAVEKDLQSCQAPFYSLKVIAREVKPHQWHVMEQWNDSFYTVVPYGNLT